MKNKLLFFILYQLLSLIWVLKIQAYCYTITKADVVGLVLFSTLSILLVLTKIRLRFSWIPLLMLPLLIFPFIDTVREYYSETWMILYAYLLLTGFLSIGTHSNLSFVAIAPLLAVWFIPYPFFERQSLYYDKVTESYETPNGVVDVVTWKGEEWTYFNHALVESTVDKHMSAEILAHILLSNYSKPKVLLLGGESNSTLFEVQKHTDHIQHIAYDYKWNINAESAINDFLLLNEDSFEVIIIDLPDALNLELDQYYSASFYDRLSEFLTAHGSLITKGGNVHARSQGHQEIYQTIGSQFAHSALYQVQIPTLGHRAFIAASKSDLDFSSYQEKVETRWLNQDAVAMMLASGKSNYPFRSQSL